MAKKITEMVDERAPRRIVHERHTLYDFPCNHKILDLIAYLTKQLDEHGLDAEINIQEYYSDDEYHFNAGLISFRDETVKEIDKRIAKAKKDKEKALIQRAKRKVEEEKKKEKERQEELKLLNHLKKKYEGYAIEDVTSAG